MGKKRVGWVNKPREREMTRAEPLPGAVSGAKETKKPLQGGLSQSKSTGKEGKKN